MHPYSGGLRTVQLTRRHTVSVTPVYDTYWKFAAKRQDLFLRRVAGDAPPWTDDPIIAAHRFTNVYRASDRVSQYLIKNVIYSGSGSPEEVVFRTLLFKFFNKIETWERMVQEVGLPEWQSFDFESYAKVLDNVSASGTAIYSAAYIMPSPAFGNERKHRNHLRLLEQMMKGGLVRQILESRSLEGLFGAIRAYPSMGEFLAFQYAIDLNYSNLVDFLEAEFVVAGPGARNGIRKCFADTAGLSNSELIRAMSERAPMEFKRLGLPFRDLWGRPLQLIDCQNLFCEVDKYARVAHPEYSGESGRVRIKQRFSPATGCLPQWYPPKWKLTVPQQQRPLVKERVDATQSRAPAQLLLTFRP